MIGKTISHYKVLEKLGEGGMGVVYKAQDTKLDRFVALKFLPQHLSTGEDEKQRFIHEAKAASALDHQNICTIYEIGETEDGQLFIAMAYYDGNSLKDKIERGPMRIDEALGVATQIAEGLANAHSKKIVHRDIKPANILITDGSQAKILDFGLAKLAGQTKLTKEGTTLGTVAYMSPEQTQGVKVDHRVDIWALGVVLYELITGRQPFEGDYEQAVMYSIMNEDPEPISGLRTGVPLELEQIVNKALAKKADERYQSVDEISVDLKRLKKVPILVEKRPPFAQKKRKPLYALLTALLALLIVIGSYYWKGSDLPHNDGSAAIQRLAVLPFSNIRNDAQNDFLGFAIADQIIGSLSYLKNILVRPSSAVRQYQDQVVDIQVAGRNLNVDFILTGSFLKEAETVRLNVELVDLSSNEMLWREAIQVTYENTFALQDMVSEKVIEGLRIQFSTDEKQHMQADVPKDPLAYEYYLRSISYPGTTEGRRLALAMLNKSIELDSTYAPAYVLLGFFTLSMDLVALERTERIKKTEQAYMKALSLNADLISAQLQLANLYTEIGRIEQAAELLREILQINPNHAGAHKSLGIIYSFTGMLYEAAQEIQIVNDLDPNYQLWDGAFIHFYLGDYPKAIDLLRRSWELSGADPENVFFLSNLAYLLVRNGQKTEALEYLDRVLALEKAGTYWNIDATFHKAVIQGDKDTAAQAVLKHEQADLPFGQGWYFIALYYGHIDDTQGCIRALEKAIELNFFSYPAMLKEPVFDPFRGDRGFQAVLAKAKAKHEAFKKRFFSDD